ncbi:MAG: bifunctional phosphopantothenoylcysteine decarboxylase/phosphopantothenate--cysteine ligase CoaBC [Fimbriimonadaceae bacterium]|nr:bifunctional phosphopantothenoylcysteine decarboxylase/phosphopantothenate--cysteine ligase CoaBC [Fimbriimonadaceae bacterium]
MNIVLGVCGSIAAYRAADLARDLMRAGHEVHVCLTDSAQQFVTPLLFETLTGHPCHTEAYREPERGRMAHIDLARQAELILIAPASANTIAKLVHGDAEDMLTTLVSASRAMLMLAPAMNPQMYASRANALNLATLEARGAMIVEPQEGDVVAGEFGPGKLAANADIVAAVADVRDLTTRLAGQTVLITTGPTQEPIDDVRYLTNRSSGKMGAAIAQMARWMGANVTVVAGPQSAPLPLDVRVERVRTALEMHDAALSLALSAQWAIGVAAVADYRPRHRVAGKLRRADDALQLELVPNPDVIAAVAARCPGRTVAFAAEPSDDREHARAKLARKGVHALAMNDVSQAGIGFESDRNALSLLWRDASRPVAESGVRSKLACARWLLETLTEGA